MGIRQGHSSSGAGRSRLRRLPVAIAVSVALMGMLAAACGGSGGVSPEEEARLKKQGAEHVHKEERLRKLEKELKHIKNTGSSAAPPRDESNRPSTPSPSVRESCGGELEVNSYTTCPFAENVRDAYFSEVVSGSGYVEAWSPVTEEFYAMSCSGSPHECTGGNNAAVYFP